MGARGQGQGRLTESSGSLNDVQMKRVFETAECEAVRNSIFCELRYEKHESQMKGCGMELRVRDLQMNAWTWRVYDTVKARRSMAVDRYALLYRLEGQV